MIQNFNRKGDSFMDYFICSNCGVQYDRTRSYPEKCMICSDERQYVPASGQSWTTLERLQKANHKNIVTKVEENLYAIKTEPQVGIGQNAYLLKTEYGNVLWDCITFLDDETKLFIDDLGGLKGIFLSHPHYYSSIVEWADAFDCPIYIHSSDSEWVARKSDRYIFWEGESSEVNPELTVMRLGGHFDGSSVMHWNKGANGKGSLLVGDTIFIVPDPGWVSFLYSHPNRIPLASFEVERIRTKLMNINFENMYGAFGNSIKKGGKEAVMRSAERYLFHVNKVEGGGV
jgi:Metallo-beta-lactamase superfamily